MMLASCLARTWHEACACSLAQVDRDDAFVMPSRSLARSLHSVAFRLGFVHITGFGLGKLLRAITLRRTAC